MAMNLKDQIYQVFSLVGHFYAKLAKKYYFEDYVRVYPQGIIFNRYGIKRKASASDVKNFKNHSKFYAFAAQFVKGKSVVDIGCGSGYGCQIIKQAGAKSVYGTDASSSAIQFAKVHFGKYARLSVQSITDMKKYPSHTFDITISSEVLEHVKEYNMEHQAIKELQRVTKLNGLIIIGTPNNEMLADHGFSYIEIHRLIKNNFTDFIIFENALVPFGRSKVRWEKRLAKGKTGVIVSEKINLNETLLPQDVIPQIKTGLKPGRYKFKSYSINTTLLHNTHSWVIIGINNHPASNTFLLTNK